MAAFGLTCIPFCGRCDIYTPVLDEIAGNSRTMKIYGMEREAARSENATGLSPADPEVEFGYLWGEPGIGNRKDVSVSQSFDFPILYGKRNRLSKEKDQASESLMASKRNEFLLEAKLLLIEIIYRNGMSVLANEQAERAEEMLGAYRKLLESGSVTRTDYNNAALSALEYENQAVQFRIERESALRELKRLNGGKAVEFDHTAFPSQLLPGDFETWFQEAESRNPALKHLNDLVSAGKGEIAVAKAEGLPKLSVGYSGEFVAGGTYQGVTAGISIPLWENRHKVRAARNRQALALMELEQARADYRDNLKVLYNQARGLASIEERYIAGLKDCSNEELLKKALASGKITLHEYLGDMEATYSVRAKLLEVQRDKAVAMAKLTSFEL